MCPASPITSNTVPFALEIPFSFSSDHSIICGSCVITNINNNVMSFLVVFKFFMIAPVTVSKTHYNFLLSKSFIIALCFLLAYFTFITIKIYLFFKLTQTHTQFCMSPFLCKPFFSNMGLFQFFVFHSHCLSSKSLPFILY